MSTTTNDRFEEIDLSAIRARVLAVLTRLPLTEEQKGRAIQFFDSSVERVNPWGHYAKEETPSAWIERQRLPIKVCDAFASVCSRILPDGGWIRATAADIERAVSDLESAT